MEDDYSYYETMTIGMTCDTRLIGAYPSRLADSRAAVRAVGFRWDGLIYSMTWRGQCFNVHAFCSRCCWASR